MSLLELDQVVKHYRSAGEEVRAVDGVTLSVEPSEVVAIQGPSGSGKTTLLLLIAALLAPDRGAIRYRGGDLAGMSESDTARYLRRDIGFVHQSAQLMGHASALENATVKLLLDGVPPRKARRMAEPWLDRVGLSGRSHHPPSQLSAGERQRVAIARALAGEPPLVLADEPTANLDRAGSIATVEMLGAIAREHGAAVILVTHDVEAATLAGRRFTLRDGKLFQTTTTATPTETTTAATPTETATTEASHAGACGRGNAGVVRR